ncbi:MAG: V-type ATP synthase subunit F [Planctomycetota bacterium]|jgi:V/A-type H+-transporting ATPase subunit F
MDFYVVADEDTVQGFRYVGIPGIVVETPEEAAAELNRLTASEAELIVITTEQIAATAKETVDAIRLKAELPLIVEIPGPLGPTGESPSLLRLIRDAVGIKF